VLSCFSAQLLILWAYAAPLVLHEVGKQLENSGWLYPFPGKEIVVSEMPNFNVLFVPWVWFLFYLFPVWCSDRQEFHRLLSILVSYTTCQLRHGCTQQWFQAISRCLGGTTFCDGT
jgi:hypothetical protein